MDVEKIESEQRGRAKIAIERLNEIHGKYQILNGDYLYTLSLFITQPIKWINRYGWRKLDPLEENVSHHAMLMITQHSPHLVSCRQFTVYGMILVKR